SLRRSRLEVDSLRSQQKQLKEDMDMPYHNFLGSSSVMEEVFNSITKVAATDANVLISGENGTGKELAARAIHRQSPRYDEVFIKVDMGSISESLFESELFGHTKGAFTDAREDRAGRFEIATGGTIFLDEIGNLPLTLQTKLLTVLQNRQVIRVGSNTPRPIDIRLICASNIPLKEMVEERTFREDLLYRINTVEIILPPLRNRPDDIAILAEHFLNVYNHKYRKKINIISTATLTRLKKYRWPGNVRELQHALERAVIMSNSAVLQPEDFQLSPTPTHSENTILENYNLEDVEKILIRKVLTKNEGNISNTAEELGLTRTSLYRRMKKYDL
ncbi:sigma-54 interaction domain-containing protein, partial [Candidatus Zixiibacteriota bacterium]